MKPNTSSKTFLTKFSGFTLAELIVVIAILAILATIGFVALGSYASNSRDATRTANLKSLSTSAELVATTIGKLPMPDATNGGVLTISASGKTIAYQGAVRNGVLGALGMGSVSDPGDKKPFAYEVSADFGKYQFLAVFEQPSSATAFEYAQTALAADYSNRYPKSSGNPLGILVGTSGPNKNVPLHEAYDVLTFTGVDLTKTTTGSGMALVFSDTENTAAAPSASGTWAYTWSLFTYAYAKRPDIILDKTYAAFDASLVGYWDMETLTGTKLADLSGYGNHLNCRDAAFAATSCANRAFVPGAKKWSTAIKMNLNGDNLTDFSPASLNLTKDSQITMVANMSFFATDAGPLVAWYAACSPTNLLSKANGYNFWFPCQTAPWDDYSLRMADTLWFWANVTYNGFVANKWYQIVAVHTFGNQKYYVNGQKVYDGTDNGWTSTGTLAEPLFVGTSTARFVMDDVRLYKRTLSDGEISSAYQALISR